MQLYQSTPPNSKKKKNFKAKRSMERKCPLLSSEVKFPNKNSKTQVRIGQQKKTLF